MVHKRTEQNHELTDEPVQPGNADRRQHHDGEAPSQHRRDLLDALEVRDETGMTTLVDPTDEEEERSGRDAVIHHLQDAA